MPAVRPNGAALSGQGGGEAGRKENAGGSLRRRVFVLFGGADEDRTHDLLNAIRPKIDCSDVVRRYQELLSGSPSATSE